MAALLSIPSGVLAHMTAVIEAVRLRMEWAGESRRRYERLP